MMTAAPPTQVPDTLEATLRASRDAGRKLLVPYITGGLDDEWLLVLEALAGAGADAIEVGVPFSDPMIDGAVIQESSLRALQRGSTPDGVLADLSRVDVGIPLVVMTYYNLIYRAGHARIAVRSVDTGEGKYGEATRQRRFSGFFVIHLAKRVDYTCAPCRTRAIPGCLVAIFPGRYLNGRICNEFS